LSHLPELRGGRCCCGWPKTGSPFRPLLDGTLRERARTMLRGGHTIAVDGGIVCANPGIKGGGWDS